MSTPPGTHDPPFPPKPSQLSRRALRLSRHVLTWYLTDARLEDVPWGVLFTRPLSEATVAERKQVLMDSMQPTSTEASALALVGPGGYCSFERHVIGCQLIQETKIQSVIDDVASRTGVRAEASLYHMASIIRQALIVGVGGAGSNRSPPVGGSGGESTCGRSQ